MKILTKEETPIAFKLTDYSHVSDNKTEIRYHSGHFYKKMNLWDIRYSKTHDEDVLYPVEPKYLERLIRRCLFYQTPEESELAEYTQRLRNEAKQYIIIDGILWQQCGEPMYCIQTFGLGHNHGGTALFVEEFYNRNIPNINYFNALDGDRAVAKMNRIAAARGDTESISRYDKMIEVLMPETVRRRPIKEHGKGNEFINKLNAITEAAPDAMTAGLLTMAIALK